MLTELEPLLFKETLSVSGHNLAEEIETLKKNNLSYSEHKVIRPITRPLHPDGGLAVLYGNLAPGGAVVKSAAVKENMLIMEGPARPYDCLEDALNAALKREFREGDIIVVRYEGPRGGPGMREMHMLSALIAGMEHKIAVITDGRFSGSSRGLCVGHVTPEAATEGPIALVEENDLIRIDIPNRSIKLLVTAKEMANRKAMPPENDYPTGLLSRYRKTAGSASEGAVLE